MNKFIIIIAFSFSLVAHSQVLLSPFGASISNGNVSISYSGGEVLITTINEGNQNITQGFQQPELKTQVVFNIINGIIQGDIENNTFIIQGLNKYPNNAVIIFNRWGNTVFEAAPYQNDWDGTHQGKPLPAATYYYVIYLDENKSEEVHGNIYILNQ